jgi:hypothetical protein
MKKLAILLCLILSFCEAITYDSLIVRKWELEEITDSTRVRKVREESFDLEASGEVYYMNFFEDGHLEAYLFDRQVSGLYTIQTLKKRLILEENEDTPPIVFQILQLDSSHLVLSYKENGKPMKLKFSLRR